MKLRCTHNSVRIRLKKSDLATLAEKGRVEEVIHFSPKSRLVFELIVEKIIRTLRESLSVDA